MSDSFRVEEEELVTLVEAYTCSPHPDYALGEIVCIGFGLLFKELRAIRSRLDKLEKG